MAFDISSDSFLEKTKIDLEKEFGEGAYVELREPTKKEFMRLTIARDGLDVSNIDYSILAKYTDVFFEMLPSLIIGHGFAAAGKPASNEQVRDAIYKIIDASNKVEAEYITWVTAPFLKAKEPASKV
jgi:hypothetical protein